MAPSLPITFSLLASLLFLLPATPPAAAQCIPTVELVASDRAPNDHYGYSVAISGDTAVVGAPNHTDPGTSSSGAAYVFVRSGAAWAQQAKIVIPGEQGGFAGSVAISGNTLATAAFVSLNAYVFTRSGTAWTQQAILTGGGDQLTSVTLGFVGTQRMIAVVGAQYATVNGLQLAGAVHVYTFNTLQPGSVWTEVARLTAPDGAASDFFGETIALSGGVSGATIVVGAPEAQVSGAEQAGAGYVFTSNNVGSGWTLQAKLTVATPRAYEGLTTGGVSINGDTAILNNNGINSYVFTRTGNVWTRAQILFALGNAFPDSTRNIGDVLVIGMSTGFLPGSGRAELLSRPSGSGAGGTWTRRAVLRAPASASGDFSFGRADMSGPYVVLGDMCQIGNGNPGTIFPSGAYMFDTSTVCAADFDCSGALGIADIFAFLNTWFAGGFGADFDGDQTLAVTDIFTFLNAWFAGC